MGAEKLSISLDSELLETVRTAASASGVSVSTWLAEAARSQVRQLHLRVALDTVADEDGALTDVEIDALVHSARQRSRLVTGDAGAA